MCFSLWFVYMYGLNCCTAPLWFAVCTRPDGEPTFNLVFVVLGPVQVHGRRVSIQRVDGVGVGQQLGQKRLKDVGEICWNSRTTTSHCTATL